MSSGQLPLAQLNLPLSTITPAMVVPCPREKRRAPSASSRGTPIATITFYVHSLISEAVHRAEHHGVVLVFFVVRDDHHGRRGEFDVGHFHVVLEIDEGLDRILWSSPFRCTDHAAGPFEPVFARDHSRTAACGNRPPAYRGCGGTGRPIPGGSMINDQHEPWCVSWQAWDIPDACDCIAPGPDAAAPWVARALEALRRDDAAGAGDWAIKALRRNDNPALPIGPTWLHEVGRDMTALGGVAVMGGMTLCVAGYLLTPDITGVIASSRKRTPRWASEISPGLGMFPPPTRPA